MANRETLIARKQALRQQIERVQRELAELRSQPVPPARRIRSLESQLEQQMGEEYNLRLAIDQSRH